MRFTPHRDPRMFNSDDVPIATPPATSVALTDSALEQPAETRTARLLFAAGHIDDGGRREALQWLLGPLGWWQWIERALLFLGLLLMRAGVVCFVAWNWADMPPLLKLGLIEVAILGACGFALWKGLDTLLGKAGQTAAAALVGAFLAVYGQVYQTGADAYELFVGWAVLILPWVILARFDALWALWIGLVNVAIGLAWKQSGAPHDMQTLGMAISLGVFNGVAAQLRELGHQRGYVWLKNNWLRWLLVPATLVPLLAPVLMFIFDGFDRWDFALGSVVFAVASALMYRFHRYQTRDLFALTVIVGCVCVLVNSILGEVLFDSGFPDELGVFVVGSSVIGCVGMAAVWLRRVGLEFRRDRVHSGAAQLFAPEETSERTTREMLQHLVSTGHLTTDHLPTIEKSLEADAADRAPWFIQALVAFGAWVSCIFFLICAGIMEIYDSSVSTMMLGTMLCVGSIVIQRVSQQPFLRHLSLALAFTGYGALLIGVAQIGRAGTGLWVIALASTVFSLVLYPLFPSSVCRFMLAAAPQIWIVAAFLDSRVPDGVHGLVLAQTLGIGAIFAWRPLRILWPLGYALVLGLFGVLIIPLLPHVNVVAWPSSMVQVVAEIWLSVWLLSSGHHRNWRLTIAIAVAAALLGVMSVPGVLAALGVIVLGHLERDGALRALGIAFLPLYLIAFYYSLDTSLLFKSGTLIASGAILWTSRFFIRRQVLLLESPANAVA